VPKFEEFARSSSREGRRETPMFTLQARGLLSFNHTAFQALGRPEAVTLLYDPEEHIVALRLALAANPDAYRVRKQPNAQSYLVGAQAFTAHYAIATRRSPIPATSGRTRTSPLRSGSPPWSPATRSARPPPPPSFAHASSRS